MKGTLSARNANNGKTFLVIVVRHPRPDISVEALCHISPSGFDALSWCHAIRPSHKYLTGTRFNKSPCSVGSGGGQCINGSADNSNGVYSPAMSVWCVVYLDMRVVCCSWKSLIGHHVNGSVYSLAMSAWCVVTMRSLVQL